MANRLGNYDDYYDEAGLPLPTSAPLLPSELNTSGPASWQSGKLVEVPTDFSNIAPGTFGLNPATQQRDDDRELRDYVASLSSNTNNNRSLPGHVHTYRPGWDAQLKEQNNPLVFAPAMRESVGKLGDIFSGKGVGPNEMASRLLGIGQERYQTWPEQLVRSGFTLPHDVATGEVPVIDPATGHTSQQLIERAQDTAGLAGGGFLAKPNAVVAAAKSSELAPLSALERAPRFYSAVEKAVKESGTKVATAEQWLGEIRNKPGVKQEELDWVLHELPQGKISKSELEQFVQSHKVELKEVGYGTVDHTKRMMEIDKRLDDIQDAFDSADFKHAPDTPESLKRKHDLANEETQLRNERAQLNKEVRDGNNTKYSQWQLPGGEPGTYREHLLLMPENTRSEAAKLRAEADRRGYGDRISDWPDKEFAKRYREVITNNPISDTFASSHWSEPNVLAHIRTNERVIPPVAGGRNQPLNSLHVEEIQSDWHQAGRKKGYQGELEKLEPEFVKIDKKLMDTADESILANPELDSALKTAMDKGVITKVEADTYKRYSKIEAEQMGEAKPVPDAPFKQNWPDLALKRIIRQAAEEGKDAISWTPGEAQAARYDLSKHVDGIRWEPSIADKNASIVRIDQEQGNTINLQVDKSGKVVESHPRSQTNQFEGRNLADIVGKEIAEKIIGKENGFLKDLDLKIGGEGMRTFYDKMLVDKANALAKKFGGKVEESDLYKKEDNPKALYERTRHEADLRWEQLSQRERQHWQEQVDQLNTKSQPIHVLRITPQLRDAALSKGFSLFADTGKVGAPLAALSRVEHNPFTEQRAYHGTLTPVESNPFTTDAYHGTRGFRGTEVEPKSGYAIHRDGYEFSVWDTTNRRTISPKFKSEAEANAWIDKRVGSELFSTSNPELADDYALGSQIMPLKLNTKDYHVFDAKGSNWQYANKHAIFEAEQLGKKGVVLKNVIDNNGVDRGPQTVYITLDPSTVRSKFAKFDPAKYGESGLLKASGLPIHQDKDGNQLMPIFTKEQYESMTHQPVKPGADVGSLKAVAVGAGKAAEWLAFLGSRNYPHINGPLTAAWIAQWPMMERMLKEDINKQLKAGKKPSEIEFSEGSIGDMFGIISSLRKKFGNDANRLTPVAHDPFNSR